MNASKTVTVPGLDHTPGIAETHRALEGRFTSRIQNKHCELNFYLNAVGCLAGTFYSDGETLEILGGVPSLYGDAYGQMRENTHGETLAVFHATPQASGIMLEIDLPGEGDLMKLGNAERVMFHRRSEETTLGSLPELKALDRL